MNRNNINIVSHVMVSPTALQIFFTCNMFCAISQDKDIIIESLPEEEFKNKKLTRIELEYIGQSITMEHEYYALYKVEPKECIIYNVDFKERKVTSYVG